MYSPMAHDLNLRSESEYDRLPECIRALYSETQYLWFSDDEKRGLVQQETEPECE